MRIPKRGITPKWRRKKIIVENHGGLGIHARSQGMRRTCTFDEGGEGLSGWREQCEQSHGGQRQLEFGSK